MRSIRARSRPRPPTEWACTALLAGAALANAACGADIAAPIPGAHGDDPTPRRGGTMHLVSFGETRSLDPATMSDGLALNVVDLVIAGLIRYDEKGNPTPDLAERWEVDDDGRTYRFFLRQGVRMHDGEELTADDVKRSAERALHPSTPNPQASYYTSIAGFTEYTERGAAHLDGVVVEGRYVVTYRLKERDAAFMPAMGLPPLRPVCRTAGTRYSDAWLPCGAGPFKMLPGSWDRGRSTTVVRHGGYFRPGLPYLDAVTWLWNVNIFSERFKLEAGDLDTVNELSHADQIRFQSDPRWKAFGGYEPERAIYAQGMNTEMAPFDNVEVRRAVAAAIDRDQFRLLRAGTLRPAYQLLPPAVPGYREDGPRQRYDYAAALDHMRRAGFPYDPATGKGGYPNVVPYYAYKQGLSEFSAQLLQQQLAKIGIVLQIRIVNYPTFLGLSRRRGKVAIAETGWQMDYPDPSDFFEPLFLSQSINDDDSNNTSFYKSPRLDALVERARHEIDPAARAELYQQASGILCDEAPWAFTYTNRWYDVWQPYVRNLRAHPVHGFDVSEVWLDRENERRAGRSARRWTNAAASLFGAGAMR